MKKLVFSLVLLLGLGMELAACLTLDQSALNVQKDVEALVLYAQQNNLSVEQTLKFAQESIDQAAHVESAELEVEHSNKRTLLIIAGVVVVVVVVAGVAYYFYKKKSDNEQGGGDEESEKGDKAATLKAAHDIIFVMPEEGEKIVLPENFDIIVEHYTENLSDFDRAHFMRALDQSNRDAQQGAQKLTEEASLLACQRHFVHNIVQLVEQSYKQPMSQVDVQHSLRHVGKGSKHAPARDLALEAFTKLEGVASEQASDAIIEGLRRKPGVNAEQTAHFLRGFSQARRQAAAAMYAARGLDEDNLSDAYWREQEMQERRRLLREEVEKSCAERLTLAQMNEILANHY
ncbi:hypothetical protein K2X40_02465 [Candidatus Babeliales bacterium]|nr:hypothetical protein [Candidatus Babeliales bacterium]